MPVRVRSATPADAGTVLALVRALAAYEREPDAVEATGADLAAQLASPDPPFECLLAEIDAVIVGFALFFRNYSTWRGRPGLYLEDLFVLPAHRGCGAGRALFQAVAARAVARGCGRLECAVLDWNEPAHAFYRAMGARPLTDWTLWRLDGPALGAAGHGGPSTSSGPCGSLPRSPS